MHKKMTSILFLGKDSFEYYPHGDSPITFTYPKDSIKELEIVNEEVLTNEVKNFITTNKLVPSTVMIVVASDLLYEKEFIAENIDTQQVAEADPKKDSSKQQTPPKSSDESNKVGQNKEDTNLYEQKVSPTESEEKIRKIQLFIDSVPFEEVSSKTYTIAHGLKVVVTNKSFYRTIQYIFTKNGFSIDAVVPVTMIPLEGSTNTAFSQEIANKILAKYEVVKENSLMGESSFLPNEVPTNYHIKMTTKVTSKREMALIGVFVLLMLGLGIIVYTTFFAQPKPAAKRAVKNSPATNTLQVSPTIAITPVASESAAVDKSTIRIQMNGGTALQADLFRQSFISAGYTNVVTRPTNVPATGRALVIFSSTLPATAREAIVAEIKKSLLNVSVQETTTAEADVVITL